MFRRLFLEHPHCVGETYLEHQRNAFAFAGALLAAGVACFLHGLVPAWFIRTGSSTVSRLYERMVTRRTRHVPGHRAAPTA